MSRGNERIQTDVLVVGGGPGGYAAAFRAADLDLDVTLVDDAEGLGGVCLHSGCIPSKTLLSIAQLLHAARAAGKHGIAFGEPDIDIDRLRDFTQDVIARLTGGVEKLAERRGIRVMRGRGRFVGSHEADVGGDEAGRVRFGHAIIATGSHPIPFPGTSFGSRINDASRLLALEDIPARLVIIGGGYVGLEMGTVYAALGSEVTLVEQEDRLMPAADPDLVKPLARQIERAFHEVRLETSVKQLTADDEGVVVQLDDDALDRDVFDRCLVAIGRRPSSDDLGLEHTDVTLGDDGAIQVDDRRRTSDDAISAIGDVAGGWFLAHEAMREGKVAAEVIAGRPAAFDARAVPAVVYTHPQVAWCGLDERRARERAMDVETLTFPWKASGRAMTMDETDGLTKLICDADSGRILGAGIVGQAAEALIAEAVLAIEMGARAEDLASSIHPHPTLSESLAEAAEIFTGTATHVAR